MDTTHLPQLAIACPDEPLLSDLAQARDGSWQDGSALAMHEVLVAQQPAAEVPLAGLCQNLLPLAQEAMQYLERLGLQPLPSPRLRADDLRYLTGPLIVFDPAWGQDIPAWLRAVVRPARLGLMLAGEKELASEEEALIYLITASLAQPLDHQWCRTYLRLGARVMARWGHVQSEADFWGMLGEQAPRADLAHEDEDLRRLRCWLRRQATSAGAKTRPAVQGPNGMRGA